ncbi:Uncharacterised protein [Klebsiella pneumoniae]|nr:Uncharacterised protein [Klebsiella pneumoniae]
MVNFRNKTRDQTAFRPVAQHHIFPVRHQQIGGVVSAKQFHIQALAQIDIIEGISAFAILPVGITTDDHFAICKPHINVSDDLWFTDG